MNDLDLVRMAGTLRGVNAVLAKAVDALDQAIDFAQSDVPLVARHKTEAVRDLIQHLQGPIRELAGQCLAHARQIGEPDGYLVRDSYGMPIGLSRDPVPSDAGPYEAPSVDDSLAHAQGHTHNHLRLVRARAV